MCTIRQIKYKHDGSIIILSIKIRKHHFLAISTLSPETHIGPAAEPRKDY